MAKLKPQNFPGMSGGDIIIANAPAKLIDSIRKRNDLPVSLSNYLVKLVQYCTNPSSVKTSELSGFYKKVDSKDKAAIQKDFSEMLGPILVSKEQKPTLNKLNLTINARSTMFIPTAGNYPLVDFMIRTGKVEDQYSVKTLQKTTNTLKAGDLLNTVSDSVKKKYAKETEILRIIDSNDAKLGPILLLAKLAPTIPEFKKTGKYYTKFISSGTFSNDTFAEDPEGWHNFFNQTIVNFSFG